MLNLTSAATLIVGILAGLLIPLLGLVTGFIIARIERQRNLRESENLSTQRRRLAEVNIGMQQELEVTHDRDRGYIVLRLPLVNLGDGPVDILGTLVSARALTSPEHLISTRSRDVGWADYQSYPWNYKQPGEPFCGISTTRYLTVASDEFPRLAVKEDLELLRVEAVRNVAALQESGCRYFMFRIFLVARGYSLGEISRQLGGRPPDPLRTTRPEYLQFQPLAQPDYYRWSQVQKALFNINRFVFRMATEDPDPLGRLCSPNAWRLFLLHHWDFIDETDAAPRDKDLPNTAKYRCPLPQGTSRRLVEQVRQLYPNQVLPDNWWVEPAEREKYRQVHELCRHELAPLIERWEALNRMIDEANAFTASQGAKRARGKHEAPSKEWYPHLIHTNPEYQARWLALMREGYLISRPQPRRWRSVRRKLYTHADIPPDPRLLEPFVMRTRFFLAEACPGKKASSASVRLASRSDTDAEETMA